MAIAPSAAPPVLAQRCLKAEIIPELFLMSRNQLFTPAADVRQMPAEGITLAVAGDARRIPSALPRPVLLDDDDRVHGNDRALPRVSVARVEKPEPRS